jgi:small subunit ribosomal protein S16
MALRIRLRRMGRKKAPTYRIVVAESSMPRDGRFVANLGHYNPRTEPTTLVVDRERALEWIGKGAVPTDTVGSLLRKAGVFGPAPTLVETVVDGAVAAVKKGAKSAGGAATRAAKAVTGAAASVADRVQETAADLAEAVRDAAAEASETVQGVVEDVRERVEEAREQASGDDTTADAEAAAADSVEKAE